MSKYVYTYRLTCFNGAAPCYDNNRLSLAICKRDMRRVIGNRFFNKKEEKPEIWMIGFVGKALAANEQFKGRADQVLYIARVTDVIDYHDCFGKDISKERTDNIYIPCDETSTHPDFKSGGQWFRHISESTIHTEEWLQQRDFDITHTNSRKYVLLSDEYTFTNADESKEIRNLIINNDSIVLGTKKAIPTGIGHCWFSDDTESVISVLRRITQTTKKLLPEDIDIKKCGPCCGDKREDTI